MTMPARNISDVWEMKKLYDAKQSLKVIEIQDEMKKSIISECIIVIYFTK